jgi:protein O-GlcNAc transferase
MSDSSTTDLLREALALHRRGIVTEAAARYAEVLRADPANADARYYLGTMSCQNGQFAEGAELARQALAHNPRHAPAHLLLGRALSALGQHDEALASFDRAIALSPESAEAHSHRADLLADLGRNAEALDNYDQALLFNPVAVEDWCNRGLLLMALGQREEAVSSFDRAIAVRPDFAQAHAWRGKALSDLGRFQEALDAIDNALAGRPDLAEAWFCKGNALLELERYPDALAANEKALSLKPDLPEAWLGQGDALMQLKRYDDALAAYERCLELNPNLAGAWLGRGHVFTELRRYEDAIGAYEGALALKPDLAEAWLGRGNAFGELKRYDDAFAAYDWALASKPNLAAVWLGRGSIHQKLKHYEDAIAAYNQALVLKSDLAEAWLGQGNVYFELKQYKDANTAYDKALILKSDLAEAWLGRGNVLTDLKQHDAALAAYGRALDFKVDLPGAWLGRGNVFTELKRYDEALADYNRAIALRPELAEPWFGQGNVFAELKRYGDAFAAYDRAVALNPDLPYATSLRLHAKLQLCNWTNLEAETAQLLSAIRTLALLGYPFALLGLPSSAADQLECAKRYIQTRPKFAPMWQGEVYQHDRIRVAYLSADFHNHPVAHLTAGLFEQHDRSRFEVIGISFGPDDGSAMRRRLKGAFDHFVEIADKGDQETADIVRQFETDIAVDLMGFTQNNRLNVLARRPAPIQVNYLGYPGTMGSDYIDYLIADETIVPRDQRQFYAERVIWVPESCLVTDNRRVISARTPTRRECSLPETAFVFSCFNNTYKITPEVFNVWMRLLKVTGNSVLWLGATNAVAEESLRREAERRGVSRERLIFAPRVPNIADHLARLRQADLFLDTLPYNAHATAIDALCAGLPLLTCIGSTFAGRVAASLLKAVGLDELITKSLGEYEALALKCAGSSSYLSSIKEKLAHNCNTLPLFDTERVTRNIESAFVTMWELLQKGSQ